MAWVIEIHSFIIDEALHVKICWNLRRGYSQGSSVGYRNAFINNVVCKNRMGGLILGNGMGYGICSKML
jgi:hypothetical protein